MHTDPALLSRPGLRGRGLSSWLAVPTLGRLGAWHVALCPAGLWLSRQLGGSGPSSPPLSPRGRYPSRGSLCRGSQSSADLRFALGLQAGAGSIWNVFSPSALSPHVQLFFLFEDVRGGAQERGQGGPWGPLLGSPQASLGRRVVMSSFPAKTWGAASGLSRRSFASRGSQMPGQGPHPGLPPCCWNAGFSAERGGRGSEIRRSRSPSSPSALPCFWAFAEAALRCVWGSGVEGGMWPL